MPITPIHALLIIVLTGFITFGSRLLPFLLFRNASVPQTIVYLGNVLPAAMMSLLIVYSLKDTQLGVQPHGFPQFVGVMSVIGLHLWKRNTLLSIFGGTILYMFLIQTM